MIIFGRQVKVIEILIILLVKADGLPAVIQSWSGVKVVVLSVSIALLLILAVSIDLVFDVHLFKL